MLYRNRQGCFRVFVVGVALMFPAFVMAQPGMEEFRQGVKAAGSKDYRSALKNFQQAKKAGLDSAALQYNLGVTYYKLGQYEKAREEFSALARVEKYKQLANYNLGLIANKQNRKSEAITAFQSAYQTGESDKIRGLARAALKRLGAKPSKLTRKKWAGLATTSYTSDSNVSLVNDDLAGVTTRSDTSIVLTGLGAYWLEGASNDGLRLYVRGYMQNYRTETDYNYSQLGAGIGKYNRLGNWKMRYGGFWDETYLGGASYQRILSAEIRGRNYLSAKNQLRLRYKFSSIEATDTVYDYLGGTRHQVRLGMQRRSKGNRLRAYYEFEVNDREDLENPASTTYTFRSYSPTRHILRVTGWLDITREWELRLDARHRSSEYNDEHVRPSNATELRKDTQTRFSARVSKEMARDLNLEMAYTVTKNDSSLDEESYDRSQASLGLAWRF